MAGTSWLDIPIVIRVGGRACGMSILLPWLDPRKLWDDVSIPIVGVNEEGPMMSCVKGGLTMPCVEGRLTMPCVEGGPMTPCVEGRPTMPWVKWGPTIPWVKWVPTMPWVKGGLMTPWVKGIPTMPCVKAGPAALCMWGGTVPIQDSLCKQNTVNILRNNNSNITSIAIVDKYFWDTSTVCWSPIQSSRFSLKLLSMSRSLSGRDASWQWDWDNNSENYLSVGKPTMIAKQVSQLLCWWPKSCSLPLHWPIMGHCLDLTLTTCLRALSSSVSPLSVKLGCIGQPSLNTIQQLSFICYHGTHPYCKHTWWNQTWLDKGERQLRTCYISFLFIVVKCLPKKFISLTLYARLFGHHHSLIDTLGPGICNSLHSRWKLIHVFIGHPLGVIKWGMNCCLRATRLMSHGWSVSTK